jgi:hypothetical protein
MSSESVKFVQIYPLYLPFLLALCSVSFPISCSMMLRVSFLNFLTIRLAMTGPTPLISPDPRYFSMQVAPQGTDTTPVSARGLPLDHPWVMHPHALHAS